ncbi:MAG TPA: glycosyltransferase family 2 protein [Solirubrobacteraceae bacterium]|jgi:rhamnosyltransferase|nr:glycosyltransferase family 2 protein [Solirubrobacteraceae bacterium]
MATTVTVAIPVKDGAATLERTLDAIAAQRPPDGTDVELMICDSGSRDGSVALARAHGAEVLRIAPTEFSHGATRNLLMERSSGAHVAFLTQDSAPAGEDWLATLLGAFELAHDVALAFGPYLPNPGASLMVARELTSWFQSFSPDGTPRIDRLAPDERGIAARALLGARGYFTDANGIVARAAWESVPYRAIAYAEDHALAHDMLRAGYAKAYVPHAGVLHSHEYSTWGWLRRSYDEARALRAVYGYVEPGDPRTVALKLRGLVGVDWRWSVAERSPGLLARSFVHHSARLTGSLLGSRRGALAGRDSSG